jgi:phage baseplate assembly protein W
MTRRSAADLDWLMTQLGTDLQLGYVGPSGWWEDADLMAARSAHGTPRKQDLAVADRLRAADQLLVNRLMTRKGELAALGHPDYGSRHHELIGEPNIARTRNLIKLHVLEAMRGEPRVQEIVSCKVFAPHDPPRDQVRIELVVRLIDEPNLLNLVVPFSLEVSP